MGDKAFSVFFSIGDNQVQNNAYDDAQANIGKAESGISDHCPSDCQHKHYGCDAEIPVFCKVDMIFHKCAQAYRGDHTIQYDAGSAEHRVRHRLNHADSLPKKAD